MKIAATFALIVAILLGAVVGLAWLDGDVGGGREMTGAEVAYIEFVVARLECGGANVGNLGYLIANADLESQDWRKSAYVAIQEIKMAADAVEGLEPSERLIPFQEAAQEALAQSAAFAELMQEAIGEDSAEISPEAMQALVDGNEAYVEADGLLVEFLETHRIPEGFQPPEDEQS